MESASLNIKCSVTGNKVLNEVSLSMTLAAFVRRLIEEFGMDMIITG